MKTIKIIDLLNLIANKEYDKLPDKIRLINENKVYIYDYEVKRYLCNNIKSEPLLEDYNIFYSNNLNLEVEIIEEPTTDDIEELDIEREWGCDDGIFYTNKKIYAEDIKDIQDKLNEVIRKINKMNK